MRTELNEKLVRTLQVEDGKTETVFWDQGQDGLGLRVRANGKRAYFVRYLFAGRECKLAIGSLSERTLPDARNRAYTIRGMAKDGVDPREKLRPVASTSLKAEIADYLAHIKRLVSASTYRQATLYLTGPYFAPLHNLDIGKVTQADVAGRLRAIQQTHLGTMDDGRQTAHAARSMLNRFYTWLNEEGKFPVAYYNPVKGTRPPASSEFKDSRIRDRVLSDTELGAIWRACGDDRYGQIVRLLILTGCRRQEVGGLLKAEVDLANRTWTIPKTRYKTKKDHTVYLAPAAVDLVEALGDAGDFQTWSNGKAALDRKLGDTVAPWTHHDLRRTMRSGLAELGVAEHLGEMAIGHAQSIISRTYNKHKYADELRAAFEAWAAKVAQVVAQLTGDNVVEFKRA